jgi:hypothetical protein
MPPAATMDAHSENDPEFRAWPRTALPPLLGRGSRLRRFSRKSSPKQFLLEKQALDCFTSVNMTALIHRLGAEATWSMELSPKSA